MLEFCVEYNGAHSFKWGPYSPNGFYATGPLSTEDLAVKPQVPPGWRKYLLANPIEAKIISVDTLNYSILIDRGSSSGIFIGCRFFPDPGYQHVFVDTGFYWDSFQSYEVAESSSTLRPHGLALITAEIDSLCSLSHPTRIDSLNIGWRREEIVSQKSQFRRLRPGDEFSTASPLFIRGGR
jgi:hypothetical protein